MLLNYQLFNWNDNSLCGFVLHRAAWTVWIRRARQCQVSGFLKRWGAKKMKIKKKKKKRRRDSNTWMQNCFCAFFFRPLPVASVHCRHFPMLLHLNKQELHKFIIPLRESFFLILLYVCSEDRFPLLAPFFSAPTYFLLMECSDCVRPRCRSCVCFVGLLIPSSFSLLPVLFMKSLLPSSHQWDSGPQW